LIPPLVARIVGASAPIGLSYVGVATFDDAMGAHYALGDEQARLDGP
jgi:hypothetical protein